MVEKPKNDGEMIAMLRAGIQHATGNDGETVPVYLTNKYFKREAMDNAIASLEHLSKTNAVAKLIGDTPRKLTALERLGLCVLFDAAGMEHILGNNG